tara:strand:- start:2567 stop:2680 length:114 start_codon:yes stop_codon:yes gene_type:complete
MKKKVLDAKGNSWEWEETPEVIEAIKKLHEKKDTKDR